jgi:benzoyl-CoA reductase/2-hydroxyglutaryl-CoA dehydratase subunit BcrC/BadD/HgdB
VIFAAGLKPVDLNNRFVHAPSPAKCVETAEHAGFPRNLCAWIKGLYAVALDSSDIQRVIAVTEGDCSNTHALMEVLRYHGKEIIPFAFPFDRDFDVLRLQIEKLMGHLGATWDAVLRVHTAMRPARAMMAELDEMTWKTGQVSALENHTWLVSSSDFEGDVPAFTDKLARLLDEKRRMPSRRHAVRLAYIGIPPIFTDFYQHVESLGAGIVFNEIQRQFSMPYAATIGAKPSATDIVEQYRRYTFPCDIFTRLEDIKREISRRSVDGVIHYTQSFCFRQIQDFLVRREIDLPILTLEGDAPAPVDGRTRIRLETFVEMLKEARK